MKFLIAKDGSSAEIHHNLPVMFKANILPWSSRFKCVCISENTESTFWVIPEVVLHTQSLTQTFTMLRPVSWPGWNI